MQKSLVDADMDLGRKPESLCVNRGANDRRMFRVDQRLPADDDEDPVSLRVVAGTSNAIELAALQNST